MYRKYKADINSRASALASTTRATVDDQQSAVTMGTPAMEYGFMGRSGVKVSNICLGTMTFGSSKGGLFSAVGAYIYTFLLLEQNYYARCLGDYICIHFVDSFLPISILLYSIIKMCIDMIQIACAMSC